MTTFRSVLKILAETGIVPPGAMVEAIGDSSPSLPEMGCINSRKLPQRPSQRVMCDSEFGHIARL